MVEIDEQELNQLREHSRLYQDLLPQHEALQNEHATLSGKYSTLSEDYIALCKGQAQGGGQEEEVDEFDALCKSKFK